MIDFALEVERQGKTAEQAIYEAALLRFRPIMMTTAAPCSARCRWPSARHRLGDCAGRWALPSSAGSIVSQMLTLYTTPVVYLYMDRFKDWVVSHLPWGAPQGREEKEAPVFAD